jgi:1-acyl-sn-glycerol-3-phosphate acyltransferase
MREKLRAIVWFVIQHLSHLEITGLEHLPLEGGCLMVGNHLGYLDAALYFAVLPRPDVKGLVASTYRYVPILNWLVNHAGGIWLNREKSDFHALRQAAAHIQQGGLLGLAPEGVRSPTHQLIQGKVGAAFLAAHTGEAPIVPVAVTGTEKFVTQLLHFKRPYITLTFGQPFTLPPLERNDRAASLQRNTDEIMCRIAILLPEKYRGVYADHPQLGELLCEKQPLENHPQPAILQMQKP